jgi:hypothetical protein
LNNLKRKILIGFGVGLCITIFSIMAPYRAHAEDPVPSVTTIVTNGGDDVSYQIPLTVSVVYDGVTYENVYATTNSVITFGRPDGTYWTYPTTPSVSIESKDWWVLPQQMPDTHFIINVSDGGFQVDGNYRPYGTFTGDTTSIIITAQIQTDGTVAYSYAVDGPLVGNERTGAVLTNGTVVPLEQVNIIQVEEAPELEPEPVPPTPEPEPVPPTPEPVPEPEPVPPTPEPVPEPEPVPPTPEPVPEPEPVQPTPNPVPVPIPQPEPPAVEPPAEEPPAEQPPAEEPPAEEPPAEEPPLPVEEPPAPAEEPPLTVEEVVALVEELVGSGEISAADAEAVLDALAADGEISVEEVNNLSEALSEDGVLTLAEKDLVADALVQSAEGEPITAANIEAAGLEYRDLPPQIPVEVRSDANGNPVVITAEVASSLLTLESPAALVGAIAGCFNPDEAIEGLTEEQKCEVFLALASIGADMSTQERQKAKEVLVAAVLVGQIIVGSAIIRRR